jgi:hypothetical protein
MRNELWEILWRGHSKIDWDINMELTGTMRMDTVMSRLVHIVPHGLNLDQGTFSEI